MGGKKGKKEKAKKAKHQQASMSKSEERRQRKEEQKRRKREKYKPAEDADFPRFQLQLKLQGLTVQEVDGDGNCFFRALSHQLYGNEHSHMMLRQRTMDGMVGQKDFFLPFFDPDDESFEEYVARMRSDGEWAGNEEVQAASVALRINITIHQLEMPTLEVVNFPSDHIRVAHLSYHNEDHYNSVRSLQKEFVPIESRRGKGDALPSVGSWGGEGGGEDGRRGEKEEGRGGKGGEEEWKREDEVKMMASTSMSDGVDEDKLADVVQCFFELAGEDASLPDPSIVEDALLSSGGNPHEAAYFLFNLSASAATSSRDESSQKQGARQKKAEKGMSKKEKKKMERRLQARNKWAEDDEDAAGKRGGKGGKARQEKGGEREAEGGREESEVSDTEAAAILKAVSAVRI